MQYKNRCTFAIISHPDAGKTTITEKLLWLAGLVRKAGMVKSKSGNFAKSDWMELERERGISITSSVMSFEYGERAMHLLDTPGHNDFSEDTYRTLTAVESVLMMIDGAKGVETQTIKLMDVCRMRDIPIITFMNKLDRESMDPFALLENVERVLSIQCVPRTWPIGSGVDFKGVYSIEKKQIITFKENQDPLNPTIIDATDLDAPHIIEYIQDEDLLTKLKNDLEMIAELIPPFNIDEYLAGIQTPVFFGSALHTFGVHEVLSQIEAIAPYPKGHEAKLPPYNAQAQTLMVEPHEEEFSGFIFKIQANMDPKHRDRMSFMRVCSGSFKRNQKIFHVRSEKEIKIPTPVIFQARDRDVVEEAYAGDIIGIYDNGKYQIGDTFTLGKKFQYTGIPNFAPEIFRSVLLKDPMKKKQLDTGLRQLSEEGSVQLFEKKIGMEKILGAVGMLQFEVVLYRLRDEYKVEGDFQTVSFTGVRWLKFPDDKTKDEFENNYNTNILYDIKQRVCYGVKSDWDLKLCMERNPKVEFFKNSDYR